MVLVATRRHAGKAHALGLKNSKRRRLPMPVAKLHLLEGQHSEAWRTKCRTRSKRRSLALSCTRVTAE